MLKEIDNGNKVGDERSGEFSNSPSAAEGEHEALPAEKRQRGGAPGSYTFTPPQPEPEVRPEMQQVLAMFCYEDPGSLIGGRVARLASALARRGVLVHIFARSDFELDSMGVFTHPQGGDASAVNTDGSECGNELIASVQEFASRACNAFMKMFEDVSDPITLMGHEWSAVPVMSLLRCLKTRKFILSIHSLERQRTDMSSAISRKIEEIELSGLREAKELLVENPATANMILSLLPDCAGRLTRVPVVFPVHEYENPLDAGMVKSRYQVGPVDPMILFIGNLNQQYGPDLLVKSLPPVLKNHGQARLVVVGDGDLYWPLKVFTRYLLLEHAVRLVGHMEGQPVRELIQAADVVVVPSRSETPWWPIQAAWAARRPVVASHQAAPTLLEHERDSILFYPSENSCVWGVERVLYDPDLGKTLADNGHAKLDERFGWSAMAALVAERMSKAKSR